MDIHMYEQLREKGFDAIAIAAVASREGLGTFETIRLLRTVCALELSEAKQAMIAAENGQTLEEYQESLLSELKSTMP